MVQVLYVHVPSCDRYTAIHVKWHHCRDVASTAPANIFHILCAHERTICGLAFPVHFVSGMRKVG
ncbi:hypothetical protein K470DRAFT_255070 [Piedraia hortae CBS 480.64]|uniref:Uncharacterized protein n=1 Tax=Piedraia hortae CBS 480.64 TaxID=1314780 RepID=A0A6A7C7Y9_9PEZI|nr:hypothetical protein K470DRAFT_255065 [Piedraia hortae CBS 480.64]KAF2863363.1 hypothetical protein K470DRAFT_255070 [Piedraia hortae CBS 480.64]